MATKEKTEAQYEKAVAEILDLFSKKAEDYGTAWRILRTSSVTDQIYIKARRIRAVQQAGENKVGEGLRPEFIGIANYSAMALVQITKGAVSSPDMEADEAIEIVRDQFSKAQKLMIKKNHDYREAWRSLRISSIADLILQKLLRIKQIEDGQKENLAPEEMHTLHLDMINCAIFALILIDEGRDEMK